LGPRTDQEVMENSLQGIEHRSLGRQAHSLVATPTELSRFFRFR
jgi:hypothetical protein